jgi:hypothetical protein
MVRRNHDCDRQGHVFFLTFGGDEVCQACGERQVSQAKVERDEAIQQVDDAAEEKWKSLADEAIASLARVGFDFIGDDVWDLLDYRGALRPREMRALGPRIQAAVRSGLIERTGEARPSVRSHLSDKPVFRGAR